MLIKIILLVVVRLGSSSGRSVNSRTLPPGLPTPPQETWAVAKREGKSQRMTMNLARQILTSCLSNFISSFITNLKLFL
jgi:hypothetical protein